MRYTGQFTSWRKGITPDDLRNRIDQIKDPEVKRTTACIVFWDFYGDLTRSQIDQTELDYYNPYMDEAVADPPQRQLESALVWIGYPRRLARARSQSEARRVR